MNEDLLMEQRVKDAMLPLPPVPGHLLAASLARAATTAQRGSRLDRMPSARRVWAVTATLTAVAIVAGAAVVGSGVLWRPTNTAIVGAPHGPGTWGGRIDLPDGNWSYGTSTRLQDGRVLILGMGAGVMRALVWDPATGTTTDAGSVDGDSRESHSATLLPDGRVLIAGGLHGSYGDGPIGSATIWDPATGDFTPTRPLIARRSGHMAFDVGGGRVLVLGGNGDTSSEMYDPAYGGFLPSDLRSTLDGYGVATRLADGRVLVLGYAQDGRCTEIWDASPSYPSVSAPFDGGCDDRTATLLPDGRVLVTSSTGTTDAGSATAAPRPGVQVFDPSTGRYTPAGMLSDVVDRSAAVALADGRVLFAGGLGMDGLTKAVAKTWDPDTGGFTPVSPMTTPRSDANATLLADGRVLVVGGWDAVTRSDGGESDTAIPSLEVFDPR